MQYRYNVQTGITRIKTNTKKYVFSGLAAITMIGGTSIPALAASGAYCGSSANGCSAAASAGAQCGTGAGSGAFGAFGGKDNNFKGGANGQQTGINNSSVCGNRP